MKKEYEINDAKNRLKLNLHGFGRCALIVSLLLGLLLSGCGQKIQKQNPGMTKTQMDAYKIIGDALSSDNPIVRVNAIEIAATTQQETFMPTIQKLMHDPYVPVRFASCVAVGEMQYILARDTVNELLRDNDPNVTVAASYAMVKLDYPEYLLVLRGAVTGGNNPTIKANSALLLGKLGDKSSIPLLYQLMSDPGSNDMVAYQAAEALASLGDDRIFEKLWGMLMSAYADVKITGVKAMGTLGTTQAENALLSVLEDPILEIRLAAAEQLGKMNNKSGQKVVLEVFQNNLNMTADFQSRERINTLTAMAIGEIGTPNLTKFLPQLMKNESPFVRLAAAKAVFVSSRKL